MDGIDLIDQRTKPLTRRRTGNESAHTPTLSNTGAKSRPVAAIAGNLWTNPDLGITHSPTHKLVGGQCYAAHGKVAASDVPTPTGLSTHR